MDIEKSNFDKEQYKADLQSAYDCGKSKTIKVLEELKTELWYATPTYYVVKEDIKGIIDRKIKELKK